MPAKLISLLAAAVAVGTLLSLSTGATTQEVTRIGCPTKIYFPSILATVAKEKGLFEKERLRPEITVYRGAVAGGAAT